jgi:6-phosphofructokinase 1
MEKIFISFPFDEVNVATYIGHQLRKNSKSHLEILIYPQNVDGRKYWEDQIIKEIKKCNVFIFIIGRSINSGQHIELKTAVNKKINIWKIDLYPGTNIWSEECKKITKEVDKNVDLNFTVLEAWKTDQKQIDIDNTISNIIEKRSDLWYREFRDDGLPLNSQIFNYEKKIIEFYYDHNNFNIPKEKGDQEKINLDFKDVRDKLLSGVPATWPEVKIRGVRNKLEPTTLEEDIQKIVGKFRGDNDYILSAALSGFHSDKSKCPCNGDQKLIFPEARPSRKIFSIKHNTDIFRVGVIVSGGIAPGINAVIDGITRRHFFYAENRGYEERLQIFGYINGFNSLEAGKPGQYKYLRPSGDNTPDTIITSSITNEGGSVIGTSRYESLVDENYIKRLKTLDRLTDRLYMDGIRILYVIGGEGSMKAAHAIQKRADKLVMDRELDDWDLNVVGIPKTMDNDILWVWQTFGFMSAVEKAREFIEYLYVETKSNPRWGIVQLFGSNSGFVVSHAVLACKSDICDLALIPEMEYDLEKVVEFIREKKKQNGLIILAETAIPGDIENYFKREEVKNVLNESEKKAIQEHIDRKVKIDCHVNDNLRSGVVKIIAWAVENEAKKRVLINEPRHLLRSLPPSTIDIINASRLGTLAVDNALAGYYGFMISQWLTEFCLIPLELVVLGRKRIPPEGIFFLSVIKKTGQPEKLKPDQPEKEN